MPFIMVLYSNFVSVSYGLQDLCLKQPFSALLLPVNANDVVDLQKMSDPYLTR